MALRQEAGTRTVITAGGPREDRCHRHGRRDALPAAGGSTRHGDRQHARREPLRPQRHCTGYNIRGIEGNRIGLDVDGIEMPDAISRAPLTNRAQDGTFGMGRDFIDPDIYSAVDIESGTTNSQRTAGGIGGAVSFRSKSPEDYVQREQAALLRRQAGLQRGQQRLDQGRDGGRTVGRLRRHPQLRAPRRQARRRTTATSLTSYPEDWHSMRCCSRAACA